MNNLPRASTAPERTVEALRRRSAAIELIAPVLYPLWPEWLAAGGDSGFAESLEEERLILGRVVDALAELPGDEDPVWVSGYTQVDDEPQPW